MPRSLTHGSIQSDSCKCKHKSVSPQIVFFLLLHLLTCSSNLKDWWSLFGRLNYSLIYSNNFAARTFGQTYLSVQVAPVHMSALWHTTEREGALWGAAAAIAATREESESLTCALSIMDTNHSQLMLILSMMKGCNCRPSTGTLNARRVLCV